MLINERDTRESRVLQVAAEMMTAARTAPKGKGVDVIEVMTVSKGEIPALSEKMKEYSMRSGQKFIARDAENILHAEAIVLIGTHSLTLGLNCSYCGYATCAEKEVYPTVPCAINSVDVGIALGSACSVASQHHVDNRIMISVGLVAQELGWMPGCSQLFAIPLSCSSKNPFFDRLPH